jgi:hypothetical protein
VRRVASFDDPGALGILDLFGLRGNRLAELGLGFGSIPWKVANCVF